MTEIRELAAEQSTVADLRAALFGCVVAGATEDDLPSFAAALNAYVAAEVALGRADAVDRKNAAQRECHRLRQALELRTADEVCRLPEWGVQLAPGEHIDRHARCEDAVAHMERARARGESPRLLTRTNTFGAWTEAGE